MSNCLSCARGMHETCRPPCACSHAVKVVEHLTTGNNEPEPENERATRRKKREGALKDAASTGRKRAAVLYPLDKEAPCEWANKRDVGGGNVIDGCGIRDDPTMVGIPVAVGKQTNRHHGPDYNTLNNDEGNVHRICARCHNAWHAKNDKDKDKNYLERYGHAAGGAKFKGSKHHLIIMDEV
jgi:hypothetical protein